VGDWLVQPDTNRISTVNENIYLRPQVMEVLVYLAGLQGQVATLESIHDDLWSGKVVSSGTIYNCIAELRLALAKDGKNLSYIETIPKKGYRLAPPVVAMPAMPPGSSGEASVAILPLFNHSKDADNEYLCEGIAEEILHRLSKVSGLKVFSALTLKEEGLDPRVVGLRFAAQMVLTGSLQRSGQRLRLTFRLDRVSNGETIWSDRYDQQSADIFSLQDAVAKQLVSAMSPALDISDAGSPVLENSGTQSLEAFNAFLLGRHAESKTTIQSYDDAIRYFEQAVVIDPAFARAHYRLYLASYMKRRNFGADDTALEKARLAAANAKQHGYRPAVPWIHIQRRLDKHTRPTTRELALEALDKIKNPDPEWGSFCYEQLTWVLSASGYFKACLDFAKRMFDSPEHNFEDSDADEELPYYHAALGQFDKAIRLWSSEIQKDPARPLFRYNRSLLYARTGQFEYAQRDIDALDDGYCLVLARAFYYFWHGEPGRIMELHQRLLKDPLTHPNDLLWTFSMTGDLDSAIEYYTKSVNSLSASFIDFGPIRAVSRAKLPMSLVNRLEQHPGFKLLLEQEGIDEAWRTELMECVNELTSITGIHINPDDDLPLV
jgi:TolB-like protein